MLTGPGTQTTHACLVVYFVHCRYYGERQARRAQRTANRTAIHPDRRQYSAAHPAGSHSAPQGAHAATSPLGTGGPFSSPLRPSFFPGRSSHEEGRGTGVISVAGSGSSVSPASPRSAVSDWGQRPSQTQPLLSQHSARSDSRGHPTPRGSSGSHHGPAVTHSPGAQAAAVAAAIPPVTATVAGGTQVDTSAGTIQAVTAVTAPGAPSTTPAAVTTVTGAHGTHTVTVAPTGGDVDPSRPPDPAFASNSAAAGQLALSQLYGGHASQLVQQLSAWVRASAVMASGATFPVGLSGFCSLQCYCIHVTYRPFFGKGGGGGIRVG